MAITREVSKFVGGNVGTFISSSTGSIFTSTADTRVFQNCTTFYGQIIDRLELGAGFGTVDIGLWLHSTLGSTMTGNSTPLGVIIDAWLQHGASSGGGDMANVAEPQSHGTKSFWTTLDTTDMKKASTGGGQTTTGLLNPGIGVTNVYDLNGASRYLRAAAVISRTIATTCSDKLDRASVSLAYIFRSGDKYPPEALAFFSTSTTT